MIFGIDIWGSVQDIFANRYEPEGARIFARIYWRTLLALTFLILVASIVYGEWDFYTTLHDLENLPTAPLPAPLLDRTSLDATLADFQTRQQQYQSLSAGAGAQVADPSR